MSAMRVELQRQTPQDERMSEALSALASPVRLAILRELRQPKPLKDIRVAPANPGAGSSTRALARQTVKEHLDKLLEIGVVTGREVERDYGPTIEYVVNHQTLFALAEEFRGLANLRPIAQPEGETLVGEDVEKRFEIAGPCLVLVKGLDEGRTFGLATEEGRTAWTIGRTRGLEVALDFDPFVSSSNAVVRYEEGHYVVEDLPESRNGTTLNFEPLTKGEPHRLAHGDLIGVGRSLLEFRA